MKTINLKTSTKLALALLACSAALTARGDYPSTVISQNPVGYWRLGETTSPPPTQLATNIGLAAPNFNGTYVADSPRGLPGPLAGGNGKSISFDGSSQYVGDVYNAALNPATFSFETWVQPKSASVPGGLLCVGASMHSGSPRKGWLLYQSDGTAAGAGVVGFIARLYNGVNTTQIAFDSAAGLGASTNLVAGNWYHVVLTFNAATTNGSIYVNGVQLTSTRGSVAFVPNIDANYTLGARSDPAFPWPGNMAESAYYSNVLSPSQVLAHYQAATTNAANYGAQILADGPFVYNRFLETPEPIAANLGTFGAAANATYIFNALPAQAGPQSPTFPGFDAANKGTGFDGNSGYVRIPALNLNSANVSMTCWINLNGNTEKANAGMVFCDSGATQGGLKFDTATGAGFTGLSYNWSSDTAANFNSGLTIPASGWAFCALVTYPDHAVLAIQDGTSFQFSTNFTTLGALPFSGYTLIGSDAGSTNLTAFGTIDEVAIFNRSLGLGEVYSEYAAAKGSLPPIDFLDPQPPGLLFVGDSLNLTVDAGGTPSLTYFWRKGGTTVTSGSSSAYSIPSLVIGDTGSYDVIISNSFGSITSAVASVTVNADTAPNLVQGPVGETIYLGGTISMNVSVTGGQMHYYWYQGTTNLASFTTSSLTIASAVAGNAGSYTVVCSNQLGQITAGPAVVTVIVPTAGSYEAAVIANSPEAWWRLNESSGTVMTDSMGRHPGTYNGNVTLGVAGLPFSSTTAANFDGSHGATKTYGMVPYSPILNSEIFTVEAWVQSSNIVSDMGILSSHATGSSGPYKGKGYFMHRPTSGTMEGDIGLNDQYSYYFITMNAFIPNKWTQVAMQWNSGTGLNFYQDGALAIGGFGDFVRNTSSPFLVGYVDPFIFDFAWNGNIADVAYYTTALSAAQLNSHYQAALYGSTSKPIFVSQPASQTIVAGNNVTFTANVQGSVPLSLQWLKNAAPIPNATNASLTLSNVFFTDAANYVLQATNAAGSSNSAPAALTVVPVPYFVLATNGLVLHLNFEASTGTYTDTSVNNTPVTPSPDLNPSTDVAPVIVAGKIGDTNGNPPKALQFTTATAGNASGAAVTSASYLELGQPAWLKFSSNVNFSVSMWVKFPVNAVPGDLPFIGTAANSTGNPGYLMAPSYKTGGWAWSAGDLNGDLVSATGAAASINNGAWHNLIYTFDRAGNAITYLDGANVNTTFVVAAGDLDSGFDTVIGQDPSGLYPEPGTFALDDIGVWSRVLSPYEAYAINYIGNTYSKSFDVISKIGITLQKVPTGYAIIWQAGTLQSCTTLNGTYTNVPGATAPYYPFTPGAGSLFFRVHP